PISPFVFEEFPNDDWEPATPPVLIEAVLSVRRLLADGFFRINTLLKKEEEARRGAHPWVSFGTSYQERAREAKKAALEVFDAFLQIAKPNPGLIDFS